MISDLARRYLSGTSADSNRYLQRRQEDKDSEWSPVTKGLIATAAVAAIATKKPFGSVTSKFINRARYTMTRTFGKNGSISKIGDGKNLHYFNYREIKDAVKDFRKTWNESRNVNKLTPGVLNIKGKNYGNKISFASVMAGAQTRLNRNEYKKNLLYEKATLPRLHKLKEDLENGLINRNEYATASSFLRRYSNNTDRFDEIVFDLNKTDLRPTAKGRILQEMGEVSKFHIATERKDGSGYDLHTEIEESLKDFDKAKDSFFNILLDQVKNDDFKTVDSSIGIGKRDLTVGEALEQVEKEDFAKKVQESAEEAAEEIEKKKPQILVEEAKVPNAKELKELGKDVRPTGKQVDIYDPINDFLKFSREKAKEEGIDPEFYARQIKKVAISEGEWYKDRLTGEIFSHEGLNRTYEDFLGFARNTLPGQLFKLGDVENAFNINTVGMFSPHGDPIFAAKLKKAYGEEALDKTYFRVGTNVYSINEETKEFDLLINPKTGRSLTERMGLISGRYGFVHRPLEQMAGRSRSKASDNALLNYFDVMQDRENYTGDFLGNLGNRVFGDNKRKNTFFGLLDKRTYESDEFQAIYKELKDQTLNGIQASDETKQGAIEFLDNAKKIKRFFNENTYSLNNGAIDKILESKELNESSRKIWQLLREQDNDKLIINLLEDESNLLYQRNKSGEGVSLSFLDKDLEKLVNEYINSPESAKAKIELWSNELGESYGTSPLDFFYSARSNKTAKFGDILRKGLEREAILRQGWNEAVESATKDEIANIIKDGKVNIDFDKINSFVDNSGLEDFSKDRLNRLAQSAVFMKDSNIWQRSKNDAMLYNNAAQVIEGVQELLTGDKAYQKRVQEVYTDIIENEISSFESSFTADSVGAGTLNNTIFTNRSSSVLDIVSSINESIFDKSLNPIKRELSNVWEGLTANRDDLSGANLYTFVPYFGIKRLSDELNVVGLGFSSQSDVTASTTNFALGFMTKRIMPIALGMTALEWTDDTVQELTGTGLWEAFTKGVANTDLVFRGALSGLGMDEWLKAEKDVNPIWQYWGGKDEYQGYDERREYYRNGYTPVRKAAWWTWGSVSEARGGEITYWQPNIVRRAESDYYDKAMYDGYFDKWSHSWIPTPTNPLSPLFALADPYWLERKHSEDRPYPVSGPMFQEGTPWGAILNPTIGALIKPEKELHSFRLHNGIDIMALMRGINSSVKQWGNNLHKRNYIQVHGADVTAINLDMFEAPTDASGIYGSKNGSISSVYGTGGADYNPASYTPTSYVNDLGNPIETDTQNLNAGFNSLANRKNAALILLHGPESLSLTDRAKEQLWGGNIDFVRNGEIIENNGQLGIYQNKAEEINLKKEPLNIQQRIGVEVVTSHYSQSAKELLLMAVNKYSPLNIVNNVNNEIKNKQKIDSPYDVSGDFTISSPAKLKSFRPKLTMDLLNDSDTVSDLMNAGKGSDFVRNAATSIRLIGGIYGYMGSEAIGLGVYNEPKIATSSDMTSFTRSFWDFNLGGLGGSASEIGRRFIPNFQRASKINPLLNNLPDWLPEKFRYGDAYASIPKGEMRLPGRGWESLNDYHSDMFSTEEDKTGAFDRFKILADIAPNSEEYKLWREIAKRTVKDPVLIDEMEEIKSRAREQGKKHDFYNYNVVGKHLNYENVVISEVLGYGKFRSGSRIFKLAGVSVQGNAEENAQQVLNRYIHVGQEVTIATDANSYVGTNNDAQHTINAAVFVNGESIGKQMKEAGDAKERKGDTSAPAKLGDLTGTQQAIGYMSEIIGHLDIPILSDQWLRIRSPYESYQAEQVYGTPYMSWSHPISTVLMPAVERAIHERSITDIALNKLFFTEHGYRSSIPKIDIKIGGKRFYSPEIKLGRDTKHMLFMGRLLTNRASIIGYGIGNIINSEDIETAHHFDRALNDIVTVAHVLTGGNSMFDMATMGAYLGDSAAEFFSDPKNGKFKSRSKYAIIGAGAAMAYRALIGQTGKEYVPDRTIKKWDMENYFDRLTYLKYMGLYKEAARRALDEEGVDIEQALENINDRDKMKSKALEKLEDIREKLNKSYHYRTSPLKKELLKIVNSKIKQLGEEESTIEGGKYTQSAIIYKKAAESTMYGLRENASWSEIVTALPKNDRDYFMEFVSEKDPAMKDKILKTASPSLRRALLMAWGKKVDKPQSNEEFFKTHYLPDKDWVGWRPNVDLNDVEVKTIDNEAMNLSDFGYYESSLRTPGAQVAWGLPFRESNRQVSSAKEIKKILNSEGIRDVEVDINENNTMGPSDIISNIAVFLGLKEGKSKVDEALRAVEY